MTTFANGESGLSVRTKINNVLQHADGTAGELVINEAGADVDFRVESDTNANALFMDGATGNVFIGNSEAGVGARLTVTGRGGLTVTDKNSHVWTTINSTADTANFNIRAAQTKNASVGFTEINVADRWAVGIKGGNGSLVFGSGTSDIGTATERLRIDSSGNLLVGRTTVPVQNTAGAGIAPNGLITTESAQTQGGLWVNRITSDGNAIYFTRQNVEVGSISVTSSATSYNTSSDYRLKEDLRPIEDALSRLAALNPVNFAWKADGTRTDGFIAHEVQAVAPQAVTGEKDGEAMQAIDHSKLVPLLTAALQEALAKIALLEARITALEA